MIETITGHYTGKMAALLMFMPLGGLIIMGQTSVIGTQQKARSWLVKNKSRDKAISPHP